MFAERLELFLNSIGETPSSIEPKIEVSKGAIYKPIKNRKTIGVEVMEKIFSKYPQLNLEWLISGKGEMVKNVNIQGEGNENVEVFYRGNSRGISKKKELPLQKVAEPTVEYHTKGGRLVTMLSQEAAASITGIVSGQQWPEEASRILLPHTLLEQNGLYFGFKVKNDSMHPTLYDGDYVISRYLEPYEWEEVKNEHIYVISTKEDGVKIKRIRNRITKSGFLRCRSDNKSVPAFNVEIQDVAAIFEVKCRLSFNFPNEQAILYERLALIEDRIDDLERKKP